MQLTEHFTTEEMEYSETAVRKGLPNVCPPELQANMLNVANHLETIRAHYGASIHVTSCYRSESVNRAVGGSKTSAHSFAHAADFEVSGVANIDVCKWIAENIPDYDQVINEFPGKNGEPDGWVHLGFTNGTPRKEVLTAVKENGKTVYKKGLIE